ncbi:hypothetical protein ACEI36_07170 [Pseudomonas kielensis]|uniref:hypothetical protein n=1 Tax=Pseudomonas kielensis TaxID=2762577 RepID=UPI0038A7EB46
MMRRYNGRWLWVLAFASTLLTGCGTTGGLEEIIARQMWRGKTLAEAVDIYGEPDRQSVSDATGEKTLQWFMDGSYRRNIYLGSETQMQNGVMVTTNQWDTSIRPGTCVITLTFDKNNVVTNFDANDGFNRFAHTCVNKRSY